MRSLSPSHRRHHHRSPHCHSPPKNHHDRNTSPPIKRFQKKSSPQRHTSRSRSRSRHHRSRSHDRRRDSNRYERRDDRRDNRSHSRDRRYRSRSRSRSRRDHSRHERRRERSRSGHRRNHHRHERRRSYSRSYSRDRSRSYSNHRRDSYHNKSHNDRYFTETHRDSPQREQKRERSPQQYTQQRSNDKYFNEKRKPQRKEEFLHKWEGISKFNDFITGTAILPVKCPLSSKYNSMVPEEKQLYWEEVFAFASSKQKPIACVINLANTLKYYDKSLLPAEVKFHHFPIAGRTTIPEKKLNEIVDLLHEYSSQGKGIVIHCTHGVNRTGYVICSYLMNKMGMVKEESVAVFQRDRGQEIERDIYLNELQVKTVADFGANEKPERISSTSTITIENPVGTEGLFIDNTLTII